MDFYLILLIKQIYEEVKKVFLYQILVFAINGKKLKKNIE